MMRFRIEVEGVDKTSAEFAEARRDINRRLKVGLQRAGEHVALPAARAFAPKKTGRLASSLIVRATARRAVLTTSLRGKKGRYVGLQEYGGTVRGAIYPVRKKALKIGNRYVANVAAPRHYAAKHFLRDAVNTRRDAIERAVAQEVLEAFAEFPGDN